MNGVGVGMTVAAPFQEDKSWYRAMVTSVDQEGGHAELLYLDFGDRAGVGLTQLKRLRSVCTFTSAALHACALHV